jgi:hypothetical protein
MEKIVLKIRDTSKVPQITRIDKRQRASRQARLEPKGCRRARPPVRTRICKITSGRPVDVWGGSFAKTRCFRHPYESPSTRSIINNTPELLSHLHRLPGLAERLPSAIATDHRNKYLCYSATRAYSRNLYARPTPTVILEIMLFARCLE